MEQWRDIEGFENIYMVSSWGRVKDVKGIIAPFQTEKGYLKVILYKDGKRHRRRVHRLVAKAFIANPNGYPQVDHIDGNKQNNSITNLRWTSDAMNKQYAKQLRNGEFCI